MKVGIHRQSDVRLHSSDWSTPWSAYCEEAHVDYSFIDLLKIKDINEIKKFDCLLWHFGQYVYSDMLEARSILYTAKKMGIKIFPDFDDSWHFDDKVAEMYLLQSVHAPIPDYRVFYDKKTFDEFLESGLQFPVVAKLRTGSGSHNVKLFKSLITLRHYGYKMLHSGYNPAPSLLYKASSNIRSSYDWKTFVSKYKKIPEFLNTLSGAKRFPHEKGYIFLQKFIPNDNYDMKVVVVGDKCAGLVRPVRSHDFRASGGGQVFFEKKYFTKDIISSAFTVSDAIGSKCMGYDYVVDKETGNPLIVEMSYGFSHAAIMASGGYFDRDFIWHDEPLNAPAELLKNILSDLNK